MLIGVHGLGGLQSGEGIMGNEKITAEVLREWDACTDGFRRFCELFPDGADLKTAAEGLDADGHEEWALWLFEHCRKDERFKEQARNGFKNTGGWNTGDRNTGYGNTGDWNTGLTNTGNWNTGNWNTGNCNTGYCNTDEPSTVRIFNKETSVKREDIRFPNFFYFQLTSWVYESNMSDKEKEAYPSYVTTGGYLKVWTERGAWRESWDNASDEDKRKVLALPNWNNELFKEISGIDVEKELNTPKRSVDDVLANLSDEDKEIVKKALGNI